MADCIDHIHQANHNKDCADRFYRIPDANDWAITAAFYAAIHYVEAGLSSMGRQSSKKSCPPNLSVHDHRENLVHSLFRPCYIHYRQLRAASEDVRYLQKPTPGTATTYYPQADVNSFIHNDLELIRDTVQRICGTTLS